MDASSIRCITVQTERNGPFGLDFPSGLAMFLGRMTTSGHSGPSYVPFWLPLISHDVICFIAIIYLLNSKVGTVSLMISDKRHNMDQVMRSPPNSSILESPRPQTSTSHQDQMRPISRVAQLHRRSDEDIPGIQALREDPSQSEPRASNTSQNHNSPSLSQHSSRNSSNPPISPLYQTVIPAFNPNHYDLSSGTVCLCIPLTIKNPLNRWRQRRSSVKDLRARDEELRREYARLKQIENQFRGDLPPYEEAQKECIHVVNDGLERPRTLAVPNYVLYQERGVGSR